MMNLREFTELVDQKAKELDKVELQCFIHSIARKVPEGDRKEFAELLLNIRKSNDIAGKEKHLEAVIRKADEIEIRKEFDRLKELFQQIADGEQSVYADGYEDYSEGYWDAEWIWEYEDPEEVCQVYEKGCQLLKRCVNDGFYKEAVEIFDLMMETEVIVDSDWDAFSMGLEELTKEHLLSINLNDLALYVLYASYQVSLPEDRAQELYDYFSIPFFKEIKMETMLNLGTEELAGLPEFWDSWIKLLSEKRGDVASRLLKEAVIYQKGEEGMLEIARLVGKEHPSLYLEVLENFQKSHDSVRQLEVGKEALAKIGENYIVRSEIALKTAEAAILLEEKICAESCLFEAFASCSTPVNYLRFMTQSSNPEKYDKTVKDIILSTKHGSYDRYVSSKELEENYISENEREILRFLNGDFEYAMEQCCKVKQPLGWSGKFIKCGLPLFLLLMLKEETLKQGCQKMAKNLIYYMNFNVETYFKGTKYGLEYDGGKTAGLKPEDVFWQCFRHWKSRHSLQDEQIQKYLVNLEKLIDKRIRAIVSGQHRAHYESVAALAAALGEVRESVGEVFAKERILQKYKTEFSRHSSFHAALRGNGMQDTRKKQRR